MRLYKTRRWLPAGGNNPVAATLIALILTVTSAATADDTEVFFGQDTSQANVLFVVDVSGSMGATDGGDTSRLDRVKAAMTELLSTTNDLNVGLLSYTSAGNFLHQEIMPVTENRAQMLASIDSLIAGGGTPTVGALLEGARYYRGENLVSMGRSYTSPMQSACQSNHIVLLTDGSPTTNASADVESLIYPNGTSTCTNASPGAGTCGAELASWLSTTDHSTAVGEVNGVNTHTIGFNFSSAWLPSVSSAGGGQHFLADSAQALLSAFDSILEVATDSNNTFAAPAITVDQITRLSHRDDIYLALFQPNNTVRWSGNLKRYSFDGKVRDKNGAVAIDTSSGIISDEAHSYWSATVDGSDVTAGGAASQLNVNSRNVYTYTASGVSELSATVNALHEANTEITAQMLGVTDAERSNLLQWGRGVDVDGDYSGQTRLHMGDPLHSRPKVMTYGGTSANPESVVFVGTNEGFLHAIDTSDGTEVFSFIPPELLENLDAYYQNERTINRVYGLDGDLSLWVNDIANDGVISGSDRAYLYMGMRRGGRNYTALDVTTKNNPKFMWSVNGGTTGFEKLGQSWSKPTHGRIAVNGVKTDVLIFGGGYDPMQDNATIRSADTIGNDLFIVNATTGALIWNTAQDAAAFSAMQYSMPSDPRVLDMNGDGLTDQIYIGDMGGQIWRFDIDNNASSTVPSVSGGVIAELSGDSAADNRRFFYQPDVVLMNDGGKQFLAVSVGSGNRAHPLDTTVANRFYMIKQESLFKAPEGYGIIDEEESTPTNTVYRAIEERDLYDATENLIDSPNVTIASDAVDQLNAKKGWRLSLPDNGEKVLASSVTLNGNVVFTTFIPKHAATDDCSPAIGGGRVYSVSVLDATPKDGLTAEDRYNSLLSPGIPPAPAAHIDAEGNVRIVV
ncbi:MAG: PilC/PilY family type IV pilus protein, partial [Pseudomonadota bacterium]